jgi:hypothetical protein
MTVIQMSERELMRLRVLIDLSDRRLTVAAAARLMGEKRRRLRRAWFHASMVAQAITATVRHSVEPF